MAALHFLLPTGDSRSGSRSFDSKLISLPPLDEVPVHVHRFAARAPCDSQGSQCQCGIHTAEAASALRSRKTERAAKEKPTPISQIFFSTCCAWECENSTPPPAGSQGSYTQPCGRSNAYPSIYVPKRLRRHTASALCLGIRSST